VSLFSTSRVIVFPVRVFTNICIADVLILSTEKLELGKKGKLMREMGFYRVL
jgi:hypothetical protein